MADTVQKVDYFAARVADKPGKAADMLAKLRDAGVNLLGFTGFPRGKSSQIDFVPQDAKAFKAAARQAKLKFKKQKTGFVIQGDDRPGALADTLGKLADAGINVTAVDAVCAGAGRYGAMLWVKQKDVKKAGKALGAR